MSTEQHRKMLECAAKACGITGVWQEGFGICVIGDYLKDPGEQVKFWNPLTNPGDTAEMCAKLDINTFFYHSTKKVECWSDDHGDEQTTRHVTAYNGTSEGKLKAWMEAATIVAAKIGGYEE